MSSDTSLTGKSSSSNRMQGLQTSDAERQERSGRVSSYTRFVQSMRVILPLGATAIIMLLILWPQIENPNKNTDIRNLNDEEQVKQAVQSNKLLTARYEDVDSNGRPFVIEADEAMQENDNPDLIILRYPRADVRLDDTMGLKIKAKDGKFAQESQDLLLTGGAYFTRSDGTVLRTERIQGQLKEGTAHTNEAVFIEGPSGTLDAAGMTIEDKGMRVIFKGPAVMRIRAANDVIPNKNITETRQPE
jgi:lipopolysaccharide export system protein LptC